MDDGNKLRVLRCESGYSQQKVADELGISKSKYCRVEANEAKLDTGELRKLLKLYTISADDFLEMKFPIHHRVIFPKELLDNLERVLEENKELTENWNENRERFNQLRKAANPVLEIRMKACDFPELDLKLIDAGTVVKTVALDGRGENLINRYLALSEKYCRVLFGGA